MPATSTSAPIDPALRAPLPVLGRDVTVPLVTGGHVTYAALDYAASAPALERVWDDVAAFLPYYGSVHRGAGYLSQLSTALLERSRDTVRQHLGVRPDDEVLFTRSTTDSLNLLAGALPGDTEVYVFETEHHAALLPWHDGATTVLAAPCSAQDAVDRLTAALAGRSRGRPGLVCVTGASNVTGELWPVAELASVAHAAGARLVLDAAQLAPHRPIDVGALGVDYVAFSGHKMYAPFGAGVLAGRADWLGAARPYLAGGGASRRVEVTAAGTLDVQWHGGSTRHEAGSPNVVGAYAVASACRALAEAGFSALVEREDALLRRLTGGLAAIPGVTLLSLLGDGAPRVGVVSFVIEGWRSSQVAAALSAEHGIGVRDGLFCAHPLMRVLVGAVHQGPASGRDSRPQGRSQHAIRASFGAGTPVEHVDRLVDAVSSIVHEGTRHEYRNDGERCAPVR
ncbi:MULTISPECIES: aminotransferase class V-fold PLP-dependent enzyme [Micromonospora]|uniref:Aminotransferase class V-fold PLP-dependent enzyme n=1 Tax=Micromonospora antibiotica TaxID=2807623 RepID=A0ABS3V2C7_9ACTN|nr:aminotransferase class V-fold PLP-dependent enzyme [Micromonospora antibiotica]MBO4159723.1 aminotransferase class V-fold PLP-dependent enzyme [Micromonospora antibiotica]